MRLLTKLFRGDPQHAGAAELLAASGAPQRLQELALAHEEWCAQLVKPYGSAAAVQEQLTNADDEQRRAAAALVLALLGLPDAESRLKVHLYNSPPAAVLSVLARRRLGWAPEEVRWLLEQVSRLIDGSWEAYTGDLLRVPLAAAERLPEDERGLIQTIVNRLLVIVQAHTGWWDPADYRRTQRRLRSLLLTERAATGIPPSVLHEGDTYGPAARAALIEAVGEPAAAAVLRHLESYGQGVAPKKAWRSALVGVAAEVPVVEVARMLVTRFVEHQETPGEVQWSGETYTAWTFVHPDAAAIVRAAVWVVAGAAEPWVAPLLGDAAVRAGEGFGGSGGDSRCAPVANSAIAALAELAAAGAADPVAVVAQLSKVRAKVQNKGVRRYTDTALTTTADAAGLTPGQLLERAVPTFGLGADGCGRVPVGDHTAVLRLDTSAASAKLVIRWCDPSGKERAAVPAVVKDAHQAQLTELRAVAKEVKKAAATQRTRLEDLLATERTWGGGEWVAQYAAHPVVGGHARRLIWQVAQGDEWASGLPERSGDTWTLRCHTGRSTAVGTDDTLRLWHPVHVPLAEVQAWRARLADDQFRQPFKQAFRELYLLTPAEERTSTYSNRFAAHVLRYPQAGALMRTRGWSGNHLGYWDGGYEGTATKELGEAGWRASFFYELVENDADGYGTPSLCSTDQVRFERREGAGVRTHWELAALSDVPALVFSEAMRDVDLFVGVTSIASDPNWLDGGAERHHDYWNRVSFGELTESAEMRREALRRLLPRTRIADRVELTDRFLVVHGSIRDYRIHLGSTNILMSPADTYLCIVPGRGPAAAERLFLPFEEDNGKLALILSKAFLLADDAAITDPSITRQLRI